MCPTIVIFWETLAFISYLSQIPLWLPCYIHVYAHSHLYSMPWRRSSFLWKVETLRLFCLLIFPWRVCITSMANYEYENDEINDAILMQGQDGIVCSPSLVNFPSPQTSTRSPQLRYWSRLHDPTLSRVVLATATDRGQGMITNGAGTCGTARAACCPRSFTYCFHWLNPVLLVFVHVWRRPQT